jgi:hypothetical protein
VPVIDETFDIKGDVALRSLNDANRGGLEGPCSEGIASEWRVGARGAMEGRCRCAESEADRRALLLLSVRGYGKGAEEDSWDDGMTKHDGIPATFKCSRTMLAKETLSPEVSRSGRDLTGLPARQR